MEAAPADGRGAAEREDIETGTRWPPAGWRAAGFRSPGDRPILVRILLEDRGRSQVAWKRPPARIDTGHRSLYRSTQHIDGDNDMTSGTLSSKYQVAMPRAARGAPGVRPGDRNL